MRSKTLLVGIVIGLLLAAGGIVVAGSLDPVTPPGATSSYTLESIYQRLIVGMAGSQSTFTEPVAGPGSTMHTLDDIMGAAPAADDANGATAAEVLAGKTFWSLRSSAWGLKTGSAAQGNNVSGADGSKVFPIPDGFYAGKTATANDSDLVAGNVKQGVDIFGVAGTLAPGSTYNAGVPKTGQTTSIATGDDGDLEKGVAWPSPRFTDNGNGTVTDNLTGLIWLQNANCANATRNWATALTDVAQLNTNGTMNSNNCGDTSNGGSHQTDWRLPNVREMYSLIDYGRYIPALPSGHPFTGVQLYNYSTSTTFAVYASVAWYVDLINGIVDGVDKTYSNYVWPVRGGQ